MFEAEVEMEKRSSILPLLLMMCLIVAIVGLIGYVVLQAKGQTPLTTQEATPIVAAAVHGPGPAVIHFRTGLLRPTGDDKPSDPNYRLLEKAGIVKLARAAQGKVAVSLTPAGERMIAAVPGSKKSKEANGTFTYEVPLAQRQFLSVAGVNMVGTNGAAVDYNWKWDPNPVGLVFDAGGPLVKSFNLWDRQNLINKYGVDFYSSGPTKSTLALARSGNSKDKEWKIAAQ
jgi:hypothetical protein